MVLASGSHDLVHVAMHSQMVVRSLCTPSGRCHEEGERGRVGLGWIRFERVPPGTSQVEKSRRLLCTVKAVYHSLTSFEESSEAFGAIASIAVQR